MCLSIDIHVCIDVFKYVFLCVCVCVCGSTVYSCALFVAIC